ncbi:hypothetical protein NT04LM_3760 [Listeria monocytogenes FSL F2-208]|nr:hypothetical protein NT04LM_3760 [Listeria monocytogenes FSL F2-208]
MSALREICTLICTLFSTSVASLFMLINIAKNTLTKISVTVTALAAAKVIQPFR